jgi:two-component system LytT family response regulator
MEPIRTLIVDDELLARRRIRNLLRGRTEFEIVAECANGRQAAAAIAEHAPSLVFLDVQMPDLDGFGVLREISGEPLPVIVFVTAYDQYAVRAFEVHALDYLLKPFDDERFEKTLHWAKAQLQRNELHQVSQKMLALLEDYHDERPPDRGTIRAEESKASSQPGPLTRLIVKSAGRVLFVKAEEIDWISAESYYARLHVGRQSYLLRESLSSLEAQLDPARFLRIHRSTIVNLERIRELQPQSHGEYAVILQNGTQLRLSRSYRDKLDQLLRRSG